MVTPLKVSVEVIGRGKSDLATFSIDGRPLSSQSPFDPPTRFALRNVRHNARVSLAHERRHIDTFSSFPIIAETHGHQVTLYSVRRYGDVLGVGLATRETIAIPTNVHELRSFLQSNSLDILLAFGVTILHQRDEMLFERTPDVVDICLLDVLSLPSVIEPSQTYVHM